MPRKSTKKEKVEMPTKPVGIPPKPREKLTPGQVLYCWYPPTNEYHKRAYLRDYKGEDEILCEDPETKQQWILNISHLHSTIFTEKEYVERMDKHIS